MGEFSGDDRGLAGGIIGFFAIIIMAALLFTLLDPAIVEVFDLTSSQSTSQGSQDVIDLRKQIWGLMPVFALFLAAVALISRAVFESRAPG